MNIRIKYLYTNNNFLLFTLQGNSHKITVTHFALIPFGKNSRLGQWKTWLIGNRETNRITQVSLNGTSNTVWYEIFVGSNFAIFFNDL